MNTCPLCSRYGLALFVAGLIVMLLPFQYALWLGMILIIAAYIVPNLIPQSCGIQGPPPGPPGDSETRNTENKNVK